MRSFAPLRMTFGEWPTADSPLAVVELAAREPRHLARLEVVGAAVEADEVFAVDVDLDRRAVAEVVHLVDLVDVRNEERDVARLDQRRAVLLQHDVVVALAVVDPAEARLLD